MHPEQRQIPRDVRTRSLAATGSAILWDSAFWHTSGANCGTAPRYSLVFYFQRRWVRGFNDAYRLCPLEARARMTEEERRVWGLEAAVPPNTHFREMTPDQIEALTRRGMFAARTTLGS